MLMDAFLSAMTNIVFIAGVPFVVYLTYHKRRHKRGVAEIMQRAGLQHGEFKYVVYSIVFALALVVVVIVWPPPLEPFTREGSPQRAFVGLGLSGTSVVMALLYGVVKTGFSEELLFRGLIAGSLGRRLPLGRANFLQALIFLLPHFLILGFMPEMWPILPVVFAGAFFLGWVRIKSGSMVGPWLVHAALNVAMCLSVAIRSSGL